MLLCISLGFAVGLGEVMIRLVRPQNLSGSWRVACPRGFQINKAGGSARHQFGERCVRYRFNDHHLRGGPLQDAEVRILCLGDSFTFGWLLDEQYTFVHRLGELSNQGLSKNRYEFLNGGAGGWGTSQYVAFFEEIGRDLRPNFVVVFLNFEDIKRSVEAPLYSFSGSNDFALQPTQKTSAGSAMKTLTSHVSAYQWCLEHSHLLQLVRRLAIEVPHRKSQTDGESTARSTTNNIPSETRLGKALFLRLSELCRERRAKLVVIGTGYQEFIWSQYHHVRDEIADDVFYKQAETFFRSNGIPFLDLSPSLRAACNGQFEKITIPRDGHPNEDGARFIAELSWPWLKNQMSE